MFTTAFDAGGSKDDQDFIVLAGFIAPADAWIEFDRYWRDRLAQEGLNYFHMVDFAQFAGEFKVGWRDNEPRRRALLRNLIELIERYASRKFGAVVPIEAFKRQSPPEGWETYDLCPYSLAAMHTAANVMRWCIRDGSPQFENISFIFEDGDTGGKGRVEKQFKVNLDMRPLFKPKKDTPNNKTGMIKPMWTPLHAADFLAYEVFKFCKEFQAGKLTTEKLRWGLKECQKAQGDIMVIDDSNLVEVRMQAQRRKP